MATGATIRVGGVDTDFDDLFEPLGSFEAGSSLGIPFLGADLSLRYVPSHGYDEWGADLGPVILGQDIRHLFRKKGWVPAAPVITSVTNDGPKYEGDLITLTVYYTALEVTSIQWYRDGSPISGATDQIYLLHSTSYTETGTYSVTVTNAGGSDTDSTYVTVIEEIDPPTISVSSDSPRYIGQTVHLTATASGYDSLQWYGPVGSPISGGTSLTYSFSATDIEESGNYTCRATNSGGHTDASTYVEIDYPPASPTISAFSASPGSAHLLDTITFTLTASDADGDLASYTITHDTGTTTVTAASGSLSGGGPTTVNPTYEIPVTNATNGTGNGFNVTVYDSGGRTATSSTTVYVSN